LFAELNWFGANMISVSGTDTRSVVALSSWVSERIAARRKI